MCIDFVHLLYVVSFALFPSMGVVAQSDSLYLDLDRLFELGCNRICNLRQTSCRRMQWPIGLRRPGHVA